MVVHGRTWTSGVARASVSLPLQINLFARLCLAEAGTLYRPAHYESSSSPTTGNHVAPSSQVSGVATPHACPPSRTGDHASCDHTATPDRIRRPGCARLAERVVPDSLRVPTA